MARLYGGRWLPSIVIISLMSVGLYLLFDKAMDVPLPLGLLDVLEELIWILLAVGPGLRRRAQPLQPGHRVVQHLDRHRGWITGGLAQSTGSLC